MVRSLSARTAATLAGAALVLSLAAVACSSDRFGAQVAVGAHPDGIGLTAFPDATVEDWVTYGDFLLLVQVTSEERLPADEEEVKRGMGLIPRQVRLRTEQIVWRRPTLDDVVKAPGSMTMRIGGWTVQGQEERPFVRRGQQPLEVGGSYVVVLQQSDLGETGVLEWGALRVLPIIGSTVRPPQPDSPFQAPQVVGLSIEDLGRTLAATEIDPVAKPYMHLEAWDRRQRVMADDPGPPQVPGPGEY